MIMQSVTVRDIIHVNHVKKNVRKESSKTTPAAKYMSNACQGELTIKTCSIKLSRNKLEKKLENDK